MEDRRQFVRLGLQLNAEYELLGSGAAHSALTRNLGGGGVSLFTEQRLASGTMLRVRLTLPGRPRPIAFTGEVIWSGALLLEDRDAPPRAFETGIRFVDITPEDLVLIATQRGAGSLPPPPPSNR